MNDTAMLFENFNRTEQKIAESYLQLISGDEKNAKITVQKIIDKARITRSTFYVYYDNVQDVHSAVKEYFYKREYATLEEIKRSVLLHRNSLQQEKAAQQLGIYEHCSLH